MSKKPDPVTFAHAIHSLEAFYQDNLMRWTEARSLLRME